MPRRVGRRLAGDEEKLFAERKRVKEFRPAIERKAVADDRLDLFAVARNPLHCGAGLLPPARRIKQHQFPHARIIVMPADDQRICQ
jgi:hypothetical protein